MYPAGENLPYNNGDPGIRTKDLKAPLGQAQPADPLRAFVALTSHHVLFPYGFPVQIKSNDPSVIRAAELSWGASRQRFRERPIEMRFVVSDSPTRRKPRFPIFRAQANLLTVVADRQNFACCDLSAGFGFACLTKAAVVHMDYLRYHFLEAMAYTLLDTQHVVAIHAACAQFAGHGVLLVGESGAGKSSFAYACAKRGWTYISDDASSLVRRKEGRTVLGNPFVFRFRPTISSLFPELNGHIKLRNGKPTLEIRTEVLRHIKLAEECAVDYIVFLDRLSSAPEPVRLSPVLRQDAFRRLVKNHFPTELAIQEERVAAIERLSDAHAYELTYREFEPAIDLLESVIHGDEP
ncbi:MAG: aldolase [Acidobacteriaceae bacterium]|nr:aldolase [Acidobacteriaceae bacterium]